MQPISDLNSFLEDGYTTEYYWEGEGLQHVIFSTHQIADLVLTSGRLIASDPSLLDTRYYFRKELRPGVYPVSLLLARFNPCGDARFACAVLKISDAETIAWELAAINHSDSSPANKRDYYGVDAGTGCFADLDAAKIIEKLETPNAGYPERDDFELFWNQVIAEMAQNSFGDYPLTAAWANLQVSDDTRANIITFSSGWGDGGYSSFWGYDSFGNITGLVTDFALFPVAKGEKPIKPRVE